MWGSDSNCTTWTRNFQPEFGYALPRLPIGRSVVQYNRLMIQTDFLYSRTLALSAPINEGAVTMYKELFIYAATFYSHFPVPRET